MDTRTDSSVIEPCAWSLVVNAKTAGTNKPDQARTSSAALEPAIFGLNDWLPCRRPPNRTLAPITSSRFPMIDPVSDALTTSMRPACRAKNAMISSAMLPNVALRIPPTCGPVRATEPLGRQADDPRETEDGRRGHHEEQRRVGVETEVQDDGRDADHRRGDDHEPPDRAQRPQDRKPAGARFRTSCGNPTRHRGPRRVVAGTAPSRPQRSGPPRSGLGPRSPIVRPRRAPSPEHRVRLRHPSNAGRGRPAGPDDKRELTAGRDLATSRTCRQLAKRPALDRFVQLGQLPADGGRPRLRHRPAQARQASRPPARAPRT